MNRAEQDAPESPGQGDSLVAASRVLRRRWWMVALTVLAFVGASIAVSSRREKVYAATATVLFGQAQLSDSTFGVQRDSAQPEREAATQVLVATSSEVTNRARQATGGRISAGDLSARIAVQSAANANVLSFTAKGPSPADAVSVANAYARGYLSFSRQSATRQLDEQISSLRPQARAVPPGPTRDMLFQQLNSLLALRSVASGQARLIGAAQPSDVPVAPRVRRDAMLAGVLGIVFGLALVYLLDIFDRRVRSVEAFERLYRLPALAAVPRLAFRPRNRHDHVVGFEPYRVLRNTIGFLELDRRLDVLLITSAIRSEGKSSVAVNLARAMALNGQQVVLVECDLRRPSLVRDLGLRRPEGGLTTALAHREPVSELLRTFDPALANLMLLPSGPLLPNAAELLRSPRLAEILSELTDGGAQVVLDAPPLLSVADAQGLLDHPQVDGAILVARTAHTTQDETRRTRAILDQHRLEPLGLVVTGVDPEEPYGAEDVGPDAPSLMALGNKRRALR